MCFRGYGLIFPHPILKVGSLMVVSEGKVTQGGVSESIIPSKYP